MSSATVPRYRQLKELIIRRISTGELRPRDRVPSENELVDSTGVSRMTANRALRELTDEGYVERVAGVLPNGSTGQVQDALRGLAQDGDGDCRYYSTKALSAIG